MAGPLDGIRVLDLSTVIAGPYATQILGDMGADIIKIEPPQGDIMRAPGPARTPGMGASFLNCNRNKRSLVLDLKEPGDRKTLLDMVTDAHVLVHNMRPKAAARLGLSYEDIQSLNPALVYCAIVGYGQDGPYRDHPAYDDIIQAGAGWAGLEQQLGNEPRYAPTVVADKTASLYAVSAINAALLHVERGGAGQYVEVPMFEIMASYLLIDQLGGRTFSPPKGPAGYSRLLSPHRQPHRTQDGYISVLPYNATHWQRFFHVAGDTAWASDPRLESNALRTEIIDELYQQLAVLLVERTTADWLAVLSDADIPCSAVNSVDDLLADPHLQEVGFFIPLTHPTEGEILTTRPPVRFSLTPCSINAHAPALLKPGAAKAPHRQSIDKGQGIKK